MEKIRSAGAVSLWQQLKIGGDVLAAEIPKDSRHW